MSARTPTGPRSSEQGSGQDDLGFDPDSPDLADPQVDPICPAKAPLDEHDAASDKRSRAYDPLANLKKK